MTAPAPDTGPVDVSTLAALWHRPHLRELALEIADRSLAQYQAGRPPTKPSDHPAT